MPQKKNPYPAKFTVQLSTEDNNSIFMLAVRAGLTPGQWARSVLHKAIEKESTAELIGG